MKDQAKAMLDKAQKKKEHFENSNKKLKDFIQKIRDFLMGTAARAGRYWGAFVSIRCQVNTGLVLLIPVVPDTDTFCLKCLNH